MRSLAALLLILVAATGNAQSVIWPAATPPCNGSLQNCIDAQPGGFVVLIATDTPSNIGGTGDAGSLYLPRSVWLTARQGFHPVFPTGVGIQSVMSGTTSIHIDRLKLRNARIALYAVAGSTVTVDVQQVDIEDNNGNGGFRFEQIDSGSYTLRLENNHYRRNGGTAAPISVTSSGGTFDADIRFNRIEVPDDSSSAYGLFGAVTGNGQLNLDLIGNRVLGSFSYGALCGVIGSGSSATSTVRMRALSNVVTPSRRGVGTGVCAYGGEGTMSVYVINNTLTDLFNGISAGQRQFSPPTSPQAMTGYIFNNLIAWSNYGVYQGSLAATVTNDNNLLFGNTTNGIGFTPGAQTVTTDPRLISRERPYLSSDSPAIDAGNSLATLFAGTPALPLFDADGHRRLKDSAMDIGAWEFGDAWFRAIAPAVGGGSNWFQFSHSAVNGASGARLQATANFSPASSSLLAPFGVFQLGAPPYWALYAENVGTPMPSNAGFNLFEPAPGSGRFLHTLASATSSSQLNNTAVNANPDAKVFVTHNWNPAGGGGVYNNHSTGVYTYAGNNWYVQSGGGETMPNGAAFNVYAQDASPTAFTITSDASLSARGVIGNSMPIDIEEIAPACTVLIVTPWLSTSDNFVFDVSQSLGDWYIYAPGGLPDGTRFNVMYSPRQVFECSGPLFRNGFE
ncbi:MAG: hypothetical protein IPF83_10965 [Rhodanobacteraceae bacterium]|nr:hypothetical protein [Rhodanobacteraceae bacterium]MBK7042355.1 hypothetical protein [Rhodanobacteraceae bacterium]MBP9153618.1 hypothetical protein [Xanthomonadales bacterium]HQW80634.1 choice-of-anchor Q domain-containing protein [Pseudomonadota bacterium]